MKEDGEWVGEKNYGIKSFVFSIESNGRLDNPMKFEKQSGYSNYRYTDVSDGRSGADIQIT